LIEFFVVHRYLPVIVERATFSKLFEQKCSVFLKFAKIQATHFRLSLFIYFCKSNSLVLDNFRILCLNQASSPGSLPATCAV